MANIKDGHQNVCGILTWLTLKMAAKTLSYLLTLPLCAGVSRVRVLSPAWTGSPARETLVSRTHLFLPHDLPPNKKFSHVKKIKYNKILTYILRSIFLKIPPFGTPALTKNAERYDLMISGYWSVWHLYRLIGSWWLIKVLMIIQQLSVNWG